VVGSPAVEQMQQSYNRPLPLWKLPACVIKFLIIVFPTL
jgi:hypothetical protein